MLTPKTPSQRFGRAADLMECALNQINAALWDILAKDEDKYYELREKMRDDAIAMADLYQTLRAEKENV